VTGTLTRRTTAADVAREAGVSPATVGFVPNRTKGQTISEETRARVLRAAEALNYKPHHAARALRSGKSKIVLLVLPDWPLEHSLRTNLEALTHTLGEHGYALITFTPQPKSRATPLWAVLEPAVVLGYKPFSAKDLADLKTLGIRNIIPNPEAPSMGRAPDLESGPMLQTEHLARPRPHKARDCLSARSPAGHLRSGTARCCHKSLCAGRNFFASYPAG
jgi:hypothetical protein